MRIAVVHSYYSSSSPSGENVVVNLQVDSLRAAGHEVLLLSRSTDTAATSSTAPLRAAVTVTTGFGPSPLAQLKAFRPDVVHIHNLFPNFGWSWVPKCASPVVATLHNFRAFCSAGTLWRDGHDCEECLTAGSMRAVVHRCYRQSVVATAPLAVATRNRGRANAVLQCASALIALAARSQSTFARARPDIGDRLRVVPNFVIAQGPVVAPQIDAPWMFVGRLESAKGVDRLVERWPVGHELVVVGSGPLEGELKRAAAGKRIRFLGQVPRERVGELLADCRALIFPSSWREPAPAMTYVEALAAGRPTLAIGANAVTDDIAAAHSGMVIPDFAGLATAMAELSDHLIASARDARRRYEQEYSETSWLHRISAVYESVVT